jgi:hypothetical protein
MDEHINYISMVAKCFWTPFAVKLSVVPKLTLSKLGIFLGGGFFMQGLPKFGFRIF